MAQKPMTQGLGPYDKRGFWSFVVTLSQGAFNDNLYKFVIIFYLLHAVLPGNSQPDELVWGYFSKDDFVPAFATFMFSMPFILFPSLMGSLSDKFSKQRITLLTKYLEVGIMFLGGVAFFFGVPALIWAVLFLMGTHSALFSPAKYGIIPELLPEQRLSWGNGVVQMATIVAILLGTGLAGPLYEGMKSQVYLLAGVMMLFSIVGLVSAHFISPVPAASPKIRIPFKNLFPWTDQARFFQAIWSDRTLLYVVLGYVYFWFAGALVQQNIIKFSDVAIHLGESYTSGLLAIVAIGIGVGALSAGFMSRGKVEGGIIPVGAAGMALFAILISLPMEWCPQALFRPLAHLRFGADASPVQVYYIASLVYIFGLGFFAGVFDVPLASTLQRRAPIAIRGGLIASTNMMTFIGIAVSSGFFLGLGYLRLSPSGTFLLIGLLSLALGIIITFKLPILLLRAVLWIADMTFVRVRVSGRNNIPEEGGVLLVCNHISFLDTLAIQYAIDRDIHFVVGSELRNAPRMSRIARFMNVIYVEPGADGADRAAAEIRTVLARGGAVCVNREKQLRAEGPALPWFADYRMLTEGTGANIVPVFMTQLWESLYVFRDGHFQKRWPGRFHYPIYFEIGEAMPADATAIQVREAVAMAGVKSYIERPLKPALLHRAFLWALRRRLRMPTIGDATTGELNGFKTLVGAIVFARKLKPLLEGEEYVGVLVPPTVGGALTNIALQFMGKIVVNLNYTVSEETMDSCAAQCGIKKVITAHGFLERLPSLKVPGEPIFLEDIRKTVSGLDRVKGMILALFAPAGLLDRMLGMPKRTDRDVCTVIFSSGSEGEPKGIMLTHRNILSQAETIGIVFPHDKNTNIVGFLPFFHSFGYSGTIWMPLLNRVRSIYHPNPLEPKQIGQIVQKFKGTVFIATPTFLRNFIRRCTPEQFATLETVLAGAEKVTERVRLDFQEKFGIEVHEGFGATELSPVVSLNLADCVSPGFYERRLRHGTIGRPMLGQCVRIMDPDTGERLPLGTAGMMQATGPNVMAGYLNKPEKTASVLQDGWYTTGDIAVMDDEGFITITDRLARFSKIGGEMAPHTRIEETMHALLGESEQVLAIAGVPDESRGERLVVLHTLDDARLAELQEKLESCELPNIFRPRAHNFHRVEAIPVLGTGKLDIKSVKRLALELETGSSGEKSV